MDSKDCDGALLDAKQNSENTDNHHKTQGRQQKPREHGQPPENKR